MNVQGCGLDPVKMEKVVLNVGENLHIPVIINEQLNKLKRIPLKLSIHLAEAINKYWPPASLIIH